MKRIIFFLIVCSLALAPIEQASARSKKKEKKTEKAKSEKKEPKSVYDKLFKDKKKHNVSKGAMTIHQYEDKLYLELPLTLIGRDFLVTSAIESASDITLAGTLASNARYLVIDKTDSLVLFRSPRYNLRIDQENENQRKAFELSRADAIYKSFPIEGYTSDSTAILFNVTSYFTGKNKDVLDLKGRSYGGMMGINSFSVQSKASYVDGIEAFDNCISIKQISSVQLTLSIMGFELSEKPEMTLSLQAMMALLPTDKMQTREANPRIGSNYIAYTDYRDVNRSKQGYYATRRKISEQQPVVFYVDTLLKSSWREAVQKSANAWNQVFENIGMGNPILLKSYQTDSIFHASNPMLNTISFINNDKSNITSYNITDPRTGEILSSRMGIPRDFAATVRKKGVYQLADVDERFRTYYIPDDVVCEALSAYMLKAFGRSLGLDTNLAGSMAYSPEQLRSPEFTQKNGITASVMDDVLYNYLARPGDKEKGVALIVNKPGVCDEFALHYLYAPIKDNEEETLKHRAMAHDGDARYFYGKAPVALAYDPRCQKGDLGNDPFTAIDAKIEHLKYVVNNSPAWFNDDNIPRDYKELFPDFVFIELYNNSLATLFPYIGGVYLNEPYEGSKLPSYQSVPIDLQQKVVQKILKVCEDLTWLDSNRDFLYLGGVNTSMSDWTYSNGVPMMGLLFRLSRMGLSVEKSENPYTQRAYLDDIEKYVFADVRSGKPLSSNKISQVGAYVSSLISLSPTLKAIQKATMESGSSFALTTDRMTLNNLLTSCYEPENLNNDMLPTSGMQTLSSIKYYMGSDIEGICYEKLKAARQYLVQARSLARNEIERGKCNLFILVIDRVL